MQGESEGEEGSDKEGGNTNERIDKEGKGQVTEGSQGPL